MKRVLDEGSLELDIIVNPKVRCVFCCSRRCGAWMVV